MLTQRSLATTQLVAGAAAPKAPQVAMAVVEEVAADQTQAPEAAAHQAKVNRVVPALVAPLDAQAAAVELVAQANPVQATQPQAATAARELPTQSLARQSSMVAAAVVDQKAPATAASVALVAVVLQVAHLLVEMAYREQTVSEAVVAVLHVTSAAASGTAALVVLAL